MYDKAYYEEKLKRLQMRFDKAKHDTLQAVLNATASFIETQNEFIKDREELEGIIKNSEAVPSPQEPKLDVN